tara:strand:+ start:9009 stop:11036 length:2028 start_codon:yes stop_codon:yes gene_type:complete
MALKYEYSGWDDSQNTEELSADEILDSLSDELLNSGNLQQALQNLLQRGPGSAQSDQMQGLRDLLQQLRQMRRDQLDKYDLSSAIENINQTMENILELEKDTLNESINKTSTDNSLTDPDNAEFQSILENIANKKQNFLDQLPSDTAGQIQSLKDYEFLNQQAQNEFNNLIEQLKSSAASSYFKDTSEFINNLSEDKQSQLKEMIKELNDMLVEKMRGGNPDFESFMEKFGDMFGDSPPESLEELIAGMHEQMNAMNSLMESLSPEQQMELEDLLSNQLGDNELDGELKELVQNLNFLGPKGSRESRYPFRGSEELTLDSAMSVISEMQDINTLERALENAQRSGDLEQIDLEQIQNLLGGEAVEIIENLKKLLETLEDAGYLRKEGDKWELTPRGTRTIGQNALVEIYRQLKNQKIGNHPIPESGRHGERLEESKPYEFGDPFHLDMRKTIMNAIEREGTKATPVKLNPDDFEIFRSELVTQTSTVLMVDLSWSMALRGSFLAAKKVTLALENLIRAQYPRDNLYIIGFSNYARELPSHELPYVRWDESVVGTNMHHALIIAEQLLAKHRGGTRQILMISDGEPTAHLENGRSQFSYPPSPITIRETLKMVKRLSQQEVTINTFMLDTNYYLKEFVNQLARLNGGRVFYTTPDQLGEYILVDYVQHKRKKLNGR